MLWLVRVDGSQCVVPLNQVPILGSIDFLASGFTRGESEKRFLLLPPCDRWLSGEVGDILVDHGLLALMTMSSRGLLSSRVVSG